MKRPWALLLHLGLSIPLRAQPPPFTGLQEARGRTAMGLAKAKTQEQVNALIEKLDQQQTLSTQCTAVKAREIAPIPCFALLHFLKRQSLISADSYNQKLADLTLKCTQLKTPHLAALELLALQANTPDIPLACRDSLKERKVLADYKRF